MPAQSKSDNESVFRAIVALLLVSAFTISGYYRRKAAQAGEVGPSAEEEGLALFLALRGGGLLLYGSIMAYIINPRWIRWSRLDLPAWLRWLGAGIGALTLPLFYWLFSSIGENITPTVATKETHTLTTDGPYRWVRHPLYSVGTLFMFAISLVAASWFIAACSVVALALLMLRLPQEEARLIEKFGDEYREYMQRTGRLVPKF